jgi:hypothetical protein
MPKTDEMHFYDVIQRVKLISKAFERKEKQGDEEL